MSIPVPQLSATTSAPCSTMKAAARSGSMPIIVRNVEPSSVTSYAIEPMTHGAPASLAAVDGEEQLLQGSLGLDDERVGAGADQGFRLLCERAPDLHPR